ncbi:hypothetical protein HX874_32670 [Pseudomonas gingeri]|nr:hypothetical protein [Pseudomonas gingeri]NWE34714.1 hypothetical protein [Pseudomonas gingeri]NWE60141.1 hypothetical protein [Pseudomonas gingeri]NWF05902.1 hypothetical protein [Pseudomonas gingeri]
MVLLAQDDVHWAARPRWPAGPLWQGRQRGEPLAACAALLEQAPHGRVSYLERVTLLLGFPHVHYRVLPWQEGLYSALDWQGFAMALFRQHNDLDPAQWQVAIDPAPFGRERLAAAVNKELLESLKALFRARRLPITHCAPLLIDALHRHWPMLPRDYRFAVREPGALGCVFAHQGRPTQVCVLPLNQQTPLAEALLMADVLCDEEEQQTLVVAAEATFEPSTALPWRWLGPLHPWLAEQA